MQPELSSMPSIHNDKHASAELMALSGGWGGRGQGLGLLACVTGKVEGEDQVRVAMVGCERRGYLVYSPPEVIAVMAVVAVVAVVVGEE